MHLTEMDVDAVLARRPQLALVDELAHTNAPGSRHTKRYQDVEELLAAGIDVYTTLNIQHLESLRDVVAQITGVTVRETVPDSVLDEASEIELIDLSPEELLQRLKEGKVYVPEQAARAIQLFFRRGQPDGAARDGHAPRGGARRLPDAHVHAQPRDHRPLARQRTHAGLCQPQPLEREAGAHRQAPGRSACTPSGSPSTCRRRIMPASLPRSASAWPSPATGRGAGGAHAQSSPATLCPRPSWPMHTSTISPRSSPASRCRSRWHELLHGSMVDQLIHASGVVDRIRDQRSPRQSQEQPRGVSTARPSLLDALPVECPSGRDGDTCRRTALLAS